MTCNCPACSSSRILDARVLSTEDVQKLNEDKLAAERAFLRFWSQGIIANYSSANVNGSHEIIGVIERASYTDITMRCRYPYVILGPNGKPYRNQNCTVHVTVTCDSIEIED